MILMISVYNIQEEKKAEHWDDDDNLGKKT